MLAITGWISLVLLCGPAHSEPAGNVAVEVRVMEMKGISWRGAAYHELTPQGRQGAAAVWTAGPAGLKTLSAQADKVIQCPRVVSAEGASSQIRNETQHNFVAHLKRIADGPPGENTKVAYEPQVEAVSDGVAAEFSCRVVEGGTMVRATVDDSHLIGFDTFTFQDSVTDPKTKKTTSIVNPQIQIPEMTTCHVAGEWLVPRGGVLVVGFGAHSTASDKSRSGLRERVVVIEPKVLNQQDAELARVVVGDLAFPSRFEPTPLKTTDARVQYARFTPSKPVVAKPAPSARPMAISPTVLPLLASPTVAPRAGWKASFRVEARMTPPAATSDEAVTLMCLPLSAAPLPIGLSNVWLGVSMEPRRDAVRMRMATPPSRGLPTPITVDGEVVDLPPLPDNALELASSHSTAEAKPSPQAQSVLAAIGPRTLDARLGLALRQLIADRHAVLNQLVCDEVIIEPASVSTPALASRVTSSANPGCILDAGGSFDADIVSAAFARLQRTRKAADGPASRPETCVVLDRPRLRAIDDSSVDGEFVRAYYRELLRAADGTPTRNGTAAKAAANPFLINPIRDHTAGNKAPLIVGAAGANGHTNPGNFTTDLQLPFPSCNACYISLPRGIGMGRDIEPTVARASYHPATTTTEPKTVRGSTLGLSLKGADGACEYDSGISLKALEAEPVTIRVPMADGTIVEIQARVVKPAKK